MSTPIVVGGEVSQWLRDETREQLQLLTRMRQRLVSRLDASDIKGSTEVPDRDWMRVHKGYLQGFAVLLVEERERAKLALAARSGGRQAIAAELERSVLGPGVDTDELEAQVRAEFARAAASFTAQDLEILARNLNPAAWEVLDRVRAEMSKES